MDRESVGREEALREPLAIPVDVPRTRPGTRARKVRVSRRAQVALGWLVGLAILYLIFRQVDARQLADALRTASVTVLAYAVFLTLTAHAIRVFKWWVVLRDEYDFLEVAVLFFSSKAFGDLSPARIGEFAPLLSGKYRSGKVTALLLVDRFFEAYATLSYGALGILLLRFQDLRVIVGGGVILLALCVTFVLLASTPFWERNQEVVQCWPVLAKGVRIVTAVSKGFSTFRHLSWFLWLISMVATALGLFFFQLLFLSVGVQVSWPLVATMVCVAAIAALIAFTPWGLGIVEAPLWWLGRLYGLPPEGMAAFYVLVRMIPLSSIWLLYGLALLVSHCREARGLL
jgi:uncharacterized protein (TIRG00374 family)